MKNTRKLKQHVSARLKYCWVENCTIFFITAGVLSAYTILCAMITDLSGAAAVPYKTIIAAVIGIILLWLILTPFSYGVKWYRIQQVRGQTVPARGIFSCYLSLSRMLNVIRLSFVIAIRKLCIIAPIAASAWAARYLFARGNLTDRNILLYCAAAAFMLIAAGLTVIYIIISIRYAPIPYIYVLETDIPVKTLIRESKRLVKGKMLYCVKVMLSVIWLIIPSLLIFPMVLILPYVRMVYTAMINEIIRQEERYADYEAG
ncbi:MAG: DUF975 family protein [Oscillospiraceae bacterium]|nr:DUF975 family protein [Oscillospiraceae bacterium]